MEETETEEEPAPDSKKKSGRALAEMVLIVLLSLLFAWTVQALLVKPYLIPSGSMLPTLKIGERILAEKITYRFRDPKVGDVVVFHPPINVVGPEQDPPSSLPLCPGRAAPGQPCPEGGTEKAKTTFIKRIVAGPGDLVQIEDGIPIVNGQPVEGDWQTNPCQGKVCNYPRAIRIPEDHYYVLGDNRGKSEDSRFWGPLPRDWITGRAAVTYWPPSEIGLVK